MEEIFYYCDILNTVLTKQQAEETCKNYIPIIKECRAADTIKKCSIMQGRLSESQIEEKTREI